MTSKNNRPIEILLVEDDLEDVRLMVEGLKQMTMRYNLSFAHDGIEAIDFLRRRGKFSAAQRPDIILLDLNMPCKDGREVLMEIKEDDNLKNIPVVVLTTSAAEEDIMRSYSLHANAFISKPVDFDRFIEVIRQINKFYLKLVQLPN